MKTPNSNQGEPNEADNGNAPIQTLSQEKPTESNAIKIPEISLPKGGGALKGIDEKFEVNAANGTAGFSIPLPLTPGRNGFSPSLSLSYNSGSGNGPFGLGWSIGSSSIQRKTDKRLPRYLDAPEEDIFMFSGAEDLVPFLDFDYPNNGTDGYFVKRYRPRTEGGFARIEKIKHPEHGVYWKVTTRENVATIFGRKGSTRIADPKDPSRIFQWLPELTYDDKGNWIQYHYKRDSNYDEKGKLLEEKDSSIPDYPYEKNRKSGLAAYTNTYLKRLSYGNQKAWYADHPYNPVVPEDAVYFFELVLDYGEDDIGLWTYREDAFSSYRSGFEIRTSRLCKRMLMFHHFKDEEQWLGYESNGDKITTPFGEDYLVRSLNLTHQPSAINEKHLSEEKPKQAEVQYLTVITQYGYIRKPDGKYSPKSLPPLEFNYQKLNWNKNIKTISPENIVNTPVGLTNNYQWVDLYNEGISGILTEQGTGWFYKNNLGDGRFSTAQQVIPKPSFSGLSNGVLSIQDLAANGKKQVVVNSPGLQGFFELTPDDNWNPFQPFEQIANIDLQDPNTRLLDLNGDGQPDIVMTEENVFSWYTTNGKQGHLPIEYAAKTWDEEQGPAIVFADQEQSIFLADISGDGLTDIVRIRNREICYWANMGYGNFSAKVTMGNAPIFDHPDLFNPQYLHLADVSGTGATDIIYLGKNTFKSYINQSGNSWSDAHEIEPFFPIDSNSKLSVIDLLGTGTSCIVWSSDLPGYTQSPMRYIDLMNSKKPHVLIGYKNNFGKETQVEYKSSTHFYLADKQAGKPWITKLPFPVQVVSKSVVEERITDVRFSSEYIYHHGYYDHPEREFRGFGMVEQIDTEHYDTYRENTHSDQQTTDYTLYQPPVLTKTWYHTGAFLDQKRILTHFKNEYWQEIFKQQFLSELLSANEPELPEAQLSENVQALNGDEFREAMRACKGMMLRQEIFALDEPEMPVEGKWSCRAVPYTVATHNCYIQLLQPRRQNQYGVFLVTESEAITFHYERNLLWNEIEERWETDPRIAHSLNTKIDELGNVLESAAVVYGRKPDKATADFEKLSANCTDFSEAVLPLGETGNFVVTTKEDLAGAFNKNLENANTEQTKTHIIYTQNSFAQYWKKEVNEDGEEVYPDYIDEDYAYRLPLPFETKTYELTDIIKDEEGKITNYNIPKASIFEVSEIATLFAIATSIDYHQSTDQGQKKRLIEHLKTKYRKNDLTALDLGYFDTLGLPYEGYQLAYTPELVSTIYAKGEGDNKTVLRVGETVVSDLIQEDGKFSDLEKNGNLWIRSGLTHFVEEGEDSKRVEERFYSPIAFEDPFGTKTTVVYDKETFGEAGRNNDGYYLFIRETEDVVGNKIIVDTFDYRSLSPSRMIDINANPSSVLVDELGLVKALAIEGNGYIKNGAYHLEKADDLTGLKSYTDEAESDPWNLLFASATYNSTNSQQLRTNGQALIQRATTRFVYNFDLYKESGKPVVVAAISREKHFAQNPESQLQFQFEYSDGLGNVAMAKVQAEPGMACYMEDGIKKEKDTNPDLRWIGNGRTILNNKGNPVKQYEPYFSINFLYENEAELVECGVTPILYYDSLGRQVKTEFPDGTLSLIEFGAWKQLNHDQNDTVLRSDWYQKRTAEKESFKAELAELFQLSLNQEGHPEIAEELWNAQNTAATNAAHHDDTPSTLYLDSLGRPVLSIENNGNKRLYTTFIQLDIEGNARAVIDARRNTVMAYQYDMLGHRIFQNSMDAGERWMLNNVMGNPVYSWDSKGQLFTTTYDLLQRPEKMYIMIPGEENALLFEKMVYGEEEEDTQQRNLRGQVSQHFDSSGKLTPIRFDFKGNLLEAQRQLAAAYQAEIIDWTEGSPTNQLETEIFTSITEYDALNRMARLYNWHRETDRVAIYEPQYNQRGVLESEDLITGAQRTANGYTGDDRTTPVSKIEYDAKGQRRRIRYGNGTNTCYHYDAQTFRLIQLRTTRNNANCKRPNAASPLVDDNILQNLFYTYDPVGNITELKDTAYEPVFFANQIVEPKSSYVYDALYRLTEAKGRENSTFNAAPTAREALVPDPSFPITDKTLRNYTQTYHYDPVGNILRMRHIILDEQERWTRRYAYYTDSNRLHQTWIGHHTTEAVTYDYDQHGNMRNYNNTSDEFRMQWDYQDRVHQLNLGGGGQAYYQYAGNLERSRKRIIRNDDTIEERLYLGGIERYRRWNETELLEEIETYHLMVDDQRVLLVEDVITTDSNLPTGLLFRYQYSNHLGSACMELNEEAAIISYEEYHPYGTTAYQAMHQSVKATAKRYRYTGKERDAESGLDYYGARYYAAWLGRWCSADPAGMVDGGNLYIYSRNSPINYSDPKGLQANSSQKGEIYGLGRFDWTQDDPAAPIRESVQESFPGRDIVTVREAAENQLIFDEILKIEGTKDKSYTAASGYFVQEALEGKFAVQPPEGVRLPVEVPISDIVIDIGNITDLRQSHLSSEIGNLISELNAGGNRKVNIHFLQDGRLSSIFAHENVVIGDPLPKVISERLSDDFKHIGKPLGPLKSIGSKITKGASLFFNLSSPFLTLHSAFTSKNSGEKAVYSLAFTIEATGTLMYAAGKLAALSSAYRTVGAGLSQIGEGIAGSLVLPLLIYDQMKTKIQVSKMLEGHRESKVYQDMSEGQKATFESGTIFNNIPF